MCLPKLSKLALEYLTVSASSIKFERLFSIDLKARYFNQRDADWAIQRFKNVYSSEAIHINE